MYSVNKNIDILISWKVLHLDGDKDEGKFAPAQKLGSLNGNHQCSDNTI